jgi:hypothetical protein
VDDRRGSRRVCRKHPLSWKKTGASSTSQCYPTRLYFVG